jgi:hypothetical protein
MGFMAVGTFACLILTCLWIYRILYMPVL